MFFVISFVEGTLGLTTGAAGSSAAAKVCFFLAVGLLVSFRGLERGVTHRDAGNQITSPKPHVESTKGSPALI
jgi:uncharacterized membrane protein YtjA (UPF0391 family)